VNRMTPSRLDRAVARTFMIYAYMHPRSYLRSAVWHMKTRLKWERMRK